MWSKENHGSSNSSSSVWRDPHLPWALSLGAVQPLLARPSGISSSLS
ncbi:hypothetical protein U9M48_007912 [Paspalum notatum var. saurae]|uniref:Uncharacterized protein n=1 Tax=Paspalum notatum var. saurae TaxID=547442 RepID=A0AAQ3SMZ4_PASNO